MNILMTNDTFITSAVFNDEAVEITFMESTEQSSGCMEIHTLAFPVEDDPEKLAMIEIIQENLRELIDRVYAERRAELNGQRKQAQAEERRLTELRLPEEDAEDEV